MILTSTEISSRLSADFSGGLLFQPLAITEGDTQRPVALLASVAQLLPLSTQLARSTKAPLLDLLHHDPAATAAGRR